MNELDKLEKENEKRKKFYEILKKDKYSNVEKMRVKVDGKFVRPENDIPVLLTDELAGNLRELKPVDNYLKERFDSFHKRNKVIVSSKRKQIKVRRQQIK